MSRVIGGSSGAAWAVVKVGGWRIERRGWVGHVRCSRWRDVRASNGYGEASLELNKAGERDGVSAE